MSNDDRTEEQLRRALSIEAQQVRPAGDGLSRIQQRVDARASRLRWMRPALAGAAAVIVVGGAVGGYAIAKNGDSDQTVQIGTAHTDAPDVSSEDFPSDAIFPYTDLADEQSWEDQYAGGHMPWVSDPGAVTQSWIQSYLQIGSGFEISTDTTGNASDVTVSRMVEGNPHAFSVVHLVKFDHAWLVTGASDPLGNLTFSSPSAGAEVTSPLTVTGPGYGVDEVASIAVRDATTSALFGGTSTSFGNGTPHWSATFPFTATSDAGVVIASVLSEADGGLTTLAAEKVTFAESSAHTASGPAAYGVEGGVIVRLDPATGASDGPIDLPGITGKVFELHQYGDSLYFTVRVGDCLANLYSMPVSGGTPQVVASGEPDYGIVGFDLSADGTKLVLNESSGCHQSMAGKGKLVFSNLSDGTSRTIDFPSEPPAITTDPVWESDGVHVDAFVRTGMMGYLARYDSTQGDSPEPQANACSNFNLDAGLPDAIAIGADDTLWVASQTGSQIEVVSCSDNQPTSQFTVPIGDDVAQSLSVSSDGQVLVTTGNGKVWKWSGTGDATQLTSATGVSSATW